MRSLPFVANLHGHSCPVDPVALRRRGRRGTGCAVKPFLHGKNSVRKHGGCAGDYQDIHDFLDSTKIALPDMRHRAVLHNAFGCFLVERLFGVTRVNSDGKTYSPRDVAEAHVIEDLGFLPTLEKCFAEMPLTKWLGGPTRKTRFIPLED